MASSVYPEVKRTLRSGSVDFSHSAITLPPIFGMTTSVTTNRIADPLCSRATRNPSRSEENLEIGICGFQPLGHHFAAHFRHDDIGDHQPDRGPFVFAGHAQSIPI